ncbi:MAG: DUF4388 domain-containing protein [Betaproteobacteria bacterium]
MAEPFPVSGSIEPAAFPHLLVDLHRRGATGSLKAMGPNYPKALYFRGGRILFGSSNDPRDQLGAILIESGRISREQLDEVNLKVGPGNPLAKVLSESGFVNQRELGEAAHAKVERILADILSWDSGSFEFEDGVLPKGAPDLKLSTEKLLFAAVQRIPDRAFALRHVDLDTVLEAAPDGEQALGEVRAEVWPLLERLDGQRTLKDAIALTRLDEFEAAKTACALLFLGIVRPRSAAPELDLAQEAQNGFGVAPEPEAASYTMPLAAAEPTGFAFAEPEDEPPVFAFEPEPPPPDAETAPRAEPAAPGALLVPERDDEAAGATPFPSFVEAEPAPEPADEEPLVVAEAPHDLPPEEPTFIMPPSRAEIGLGAPARLEPSPDTLPPEPRLVPEVPAPSQAPSRPSREDLAALDALLSPAAAGRVERPAEQPRSENWEPQFRPGAQAPRRPASRVAPRAGSSRLPIVVAAVAGIVLATIAAWYFFLRGPVPQKPALEPRPTVSAVLPEPTSLATPPAATPQPPAVTTPAVPATASPQATPAGPMAAALPTPAPTPVRAVPTPRPPAPTAPPATRPAGPAAQSTADAHSLLGRGSFPEAAHAFAASLATGSRGRFSLQLLTACSPETIQKALGAAGNGNLFILPVSLQGRSCYRLCWGVYDTRPAAEAAVAGVPAYFRQGGTRPRLSALSELLP